MVYIILGKGFEETEAVAPGDVLRRAQIPMQYAGIGGRLVEGAHGITVQADITVEEMDLQNMDMIVLPGGMGGVESIEASPAAMAAVEYALKHDRYVSAICAAPTVLAKAGLLKGVRACCYPSREAELAEAGALVSRESAVRDGTIVTSRGMGTAVDFGLHLVEYFQGEEKARELARAIVWEH